MKQVLVMTVGFFLSAYSYAQGLIPLTAKETTLYESDTPYKIELKCKGLKEGDKITVHLKDFDNGSASLEKDYTYGKDDLKDKTVTAAQPGFTISILAKEDNMEEPKENFSLQVSFEKDWAPTETIKFTIDEKKNKPDDTKQKIDTSKWSVKIITGSNFDFFDAPVFKNFAGEIKAFIPAFATWKRVGKKDHFIGLQLGIFNYRYFDSDSSRSDIITEKYLLDPTTTVLKPDTTKYIRDIYALNSLRSYNNWGAYLNPMINVHHNDWYDLFFDIHFEGIWRTEIISNSKYQYRKDTLTLRSTDLISRFTLAAFPGIRSLYTTNSFFDAYFGAGLPLKINVKNTFEIYIDPSYGLVAFGLQKQDSNIINNITYRGETAQRHTKTFFLTKFQLTTKVAPIDIVFGGEIRKIYHEAIDNQYAYKAFYLGALLSLDKLKK